MIIDLEGKRALVSGSTAGIGYAIAKGLAAAGAAVVINGRGDARVGEAVKRLRKEVSAGQIEGEELPVFLEHRPPSLLEDPVLQGRELLPHPGDQAHVVRIDVDAVVVFEGDRGLELAGQVALSVQVFDLALRLA